MRRGGEGPHTHHGECFGGWCLAGTCVTYVCGGVHISFTRTRRTISLHPKPHFYTSKPRESILHAKSYTLLIPKTLEIKLLTLNPTSKIPKP